MHFIDICLYMVMRTYDSLDWLEMVSFLRRPLVLGLGLVLVSYGRGLQALGTG